MCRKMLCPGMKTVKRAFCILAAMMMSCHAVLPGMAAEEKSLLQREQELLEQKFEKMSFPQLMSERGFVWIGKVTLAEDYGWEVKLPEPELEVFFREDGTDYLEWVDRSTEQWMSVARWLEILKIDDLGGTYKKSPEQFEGASLVSRFVSQNDIVVLETPYRDIPSLDYGDKLLVFGAAKHWLSREQYIMDGEGNMACCYKTSSYNSDSEVAMDDW